MGDTISREELDKILQEFKRSVQGKAIDQTAQWAVAGAVGLLTVAVLGWGFYLNEKMPGWVGGVPTNAILAIDDRSGCSKLGDRWGDAGFEGKFIVGASSSEGGQWSYGAGGGSAIATLSFENMPVIYYVKEHLFQATEKGSAFDALLTAKNSKPDDSNYVKTGQINPDPIKILPPYVALHFCRKQR